MSSLADREKQLLLQILPDGALIAAVEQGESLELFSPEVNRYHRDPGFRRGFRHTASRAARCEAASANSFLISLAHLVAYCSRAAALQRSSIQTGGAPQELSEIDIELSILSYPRGSDTG